MATTERATVLGVSLKLYFDVARTETWATALGDLLARRASIREGRVKLFLLPSVPALPAATRALAGTGVAVGAQDLHWADRGAHTGGISGADLRAVGCRYVEVGHAERTSVFGEDQRVAARKLQAAVRNGLCPVLCVGERDQVPAEVAATECVAQLDHFLRGIDDASGLDLVAAYEPVWAIGADAPASVEHVAVVAAALRDRLALGVPFDSWSIIYGGSAGEGTLTSLKGCVDGLFLGRFAHDLAALEAIVDEAEALQIAMGR